MCKIASRDAGSWHGVEWRFCARGGPLVSVAIMTSAADCVRKIAGEAVPVPPPCPGDFAHPTTLRFDATGIWYRIKTWMAGTSPGHDS